MAANKEAYIARMRDQYQSKQKWFILTRAVDTILQCIIVGGAAAVPILLYCFTMRMICYCAVQRSNGLRSPTLSYLFLRETVLLLADVPKTIPTIVSGIVAITAALANYYKLGEHSRILRATSEALLKEIDLQDFRVGPYKDLEEQQAFDLFVERTELVLEEHTKKIFSMQPSQQAQHIEINKKPL